MVMRFWTHRDQEAADPYGGGSDFQAHLSDIPCYWGVTGGDESVSESRQVTTADENILCAHGTDVQEGDRVVRVDDHEGRTVFDTASGDAFREVEHVADLRDFFDLSLQRAG